MTEPPLPPFPSTPPPPPQGPDGPPRPSDQPDPGGFPPRQDGFRFPPREDAFTPPPDRFPPRPDGFPPAYGATPPPATPDTPTDPGFAMPGPTGQWSEPLYAPGWHQPPYPPAAAPESSALLGPGSPFDPFDAPVRGDDDRDGPSRRILAAAGLGVLALLVVATVVIVTLRHHGSHPTGGGATSTSTTARTTPAPTTSAPTGSKAPSTSSRSATPSAPPAAPPGQAAARAIDRDITRSVAARRLIGPANTHIRACTAGPSDIAALRRAAKTRTNLVAALGRLDVSSLPGGARVVADLRTAWTYSARADLAYAAWGRAHRNCTGQARTTGDPNWDRAHRNDLRSTAAKERTVKDWNPVAARYHLTARSATSI